MSRRLLIVILVLLPLATACAGKNDPPDVAGPGEDALEAQCYADDGSGTSEEICSYRASLLVGRPYAEPWKRLATPLFSEGVNYQTAFPWSDLIGGTDLGLVAEGNGETYYFFGDTAPVHRETGGYSGSVFGLPIGIDEDGDLSLDSFVADPGSPSDYFSITDSVIYDEHGDSTGLFNDQELAALEDTHNPRVEFPFFVPTGVTTTDDTLYYWYGKYISNTLCDQSHLLAMDLETGAWRYIAPFAEQKFIQVSAVPVTTDSTTWAWGECEPPFEQPGEEGFLLFGSGPPLSNIFDAADIDPEGVCASDSKTGYRESRLYLAYIRRDDLESTSPAARAYYFTGTPDCWARGDMDAAAPVTADKGTGEFDIRRIPGTEFLVMTGGASVDATVAWYRNHPEYWSYAGSLLFVRVAHMARPWDWSVPKGTLSFGYGNYIPPSSMAYDEKRVIDGKDRADRTLRFARLTSSWTGAQTDPGGEEYGVSVIWSTMQVGDLMDSVWD